GLRDPELRDEAFVARRVKRQGPPDGPRDVVVAVDANPVGATFDPVERASTNDLADHPSAVLDDGLGLVRHHDQLDEPLGVVDACLSGGAVLELTGRLVHCGTSACSGLRSSRRSASRISSTVRAGFPSLSTIELRICAVGARSNGGGSTYASRSTSTVVPLGNAHPDSALITAAAFGRSPARQWWSNRFTTF